MGWPHSGRRCKGIAPGRSDWLRIAHCRAFPNLDPSSRLLLFLSFLCSTTFLFYSIPMPLPSCAIHSPLVLSHPCFHAAAATQLQSLCVSQSNKDLCASLSLHLPRVWLRAYGNMQRTKRPPTIRSTCASLCAGQCRCHCIKDLPAGTELG